MGLRILLCCLTIVSVLVAQDQTSEIEFTTTEAAGAFDEARTLFEQSQYKEALEQLKVARKGVKPEHRDLLKDWRRGCEGGVRLLRARKNFDRKQYRKAWKEVNALEKTHWSTPLGDRIIALRDEVRPQIIVPVEGFEAKKSSRYEVNTNPRYVREGDRSAKWRAFVKGSQVQLLRLAQLDLSDHGTFPHLCFSVYNPDTSVGEYVILLSHGSPGRMFDTHGKIYGPCHHRRLTLKKIGWHDLRFDLRKDFEKVGGMKLEQMDSLYIVRGFHTENKILYIDDVHLERK